MATLLENFFYYLRRIIPVFSSKKKSKMITSAFLLIAFFISVSQCITCPSSSPISNLITTEQCNFTGFSSTSVYSVLTGIISNSLYYMYGLSGSISGCTIRRINPDGSLNWMINISSFTPIMTGFSVDDNELYAYVANLANPLDVARLSAVTGGIIDVQRFTSLNGISLNIRVHLLSGSSGYYITGMDSLGKANICKYLLSTLSSCSCYQISNFSGFAYGQLRLSDTSFFMLGFNPSPSFKLHFYKYTFGNLSPDWSLTQACSSSGCGLSKSESLLVSSSLIYTFYVYGVSPAQYLYMAEISLTDQSVNRRYKSSIACNYVWGTATSSEYVVATAYCSNPFLLMFNRETNAFTIKLFSGSSIFNIGLDSTTDRIIITGQTSAGGYISKFYFQVISSHPDFQTAATWTMNYLTSGTDDIVAESGQIVTSAGTQTVNTATYTPQAVTYTSLITYTSDTNYELKEQFFYVIEGTTIQKFPSLTCSVSGSSSVSYNIQNYITTAPSWITIDSSTGVLTITAPEVASDTEYSFYVNSDVSSPLVSVQKIVRIAILNCIASHCNKCLSTSTSECEICNSGYSLVSRECSNLPPSSSTTKPSPSSSSTTSTSKTSDVASETAKVLSILVTSLALVTLGCMLLLIAISGSSSSILWLIINQLQLFFFLIMTRVYFPEDIKTIIKGQDFAMNIYEYISLKKADIYPSFMNTFDYEPENSTLKYLLVNSGCTFANVYSIFVCFLFIIAFYIGIFFIKLCLTKYREREIQSCFHKSANLITDTLP